MLYKNWFSFVIDQALCEDLKDELLYTYEFLNTSKLYKVLVKRGAKWLPQRKEKLFKNEGSLFPNSDFGRCVKCLVRCRTHQVTWQMNKPISQIKFLHLLGSCTYSRISILSSTFMQYLIAKSNLVTWRWPGDI